MDEWINIVVRQLILYSLPLLISLTTVAWAESLSSGKKIPHPFFAIAWKGCWVPFLTALFFHRGVIIALPNILNPGVRAAAIRLLTHLLLSIIGFLLYSWSLSQQAPAGLPPLHHWWAKVLMFFNLCMAALHLLPLPTLFIGELLTKKLITLPLQQWDKLPWLGVSILLITSLLDLSLGAFIIYPTYEWLSTVSARLAGE